MIKLPVLFVAVAIVVIVLAVTRTGSPIERLWALDVLITLPELSVYVTVPPKLALIHEVASYAKKFLLAQANITKRMIYLNSISKSLRKYGK